MSKRTIIIVAVVAALALGWYFFFREPGGARALVGHIQRAIPLPPIAVPPGGSNRSTKDKLIDAHADLTRTGVNAACMSYAGNPALCGTAGDIAAGAQKQIDKYAVAGAKKIGSAAKKAWKSIF